MAVADRGEGRDRHLDGNDVVTCAVVPFDGIAARRGQASAFHDKQFRPPVRLAERELERHVPYPCRAQPSGGGRDRLDIDPAPAAVVESTGDRVDVGMNRADVYVEARLDFPQRTPEQHVLEVLCVRDKRHARSIRRTDKQAASRLVLRVRPPVRAALTTREFQVGERGPACGPDCLWH